MKLKIQKYKLYWISWLCFGWMFFGSIASSMGVICLKAYLVGSLLLAFLEIAKYLEQKAKEEGEL